jgi:hypothetical protein
LYCTSTDTIVQIPMGGMHNRKRHHAAGRKKTDQTFRCMPRPPPEQCRLGCTRTHTHKEECTDALRMQYGCIWMLKLDVVDQHVRSGHVVGLWIAAWCLSNGEIPELDLALDLSKRLTIDHEAMRLVVGIRSLSPLSL